MQIRNIAIIAHVDHGKTTLTDAMMRQTGMVSEGTSMDSNALEQERGITIYAKNASIIYKNSKINIVDTPGHADFGSEVERVLRAIDSVLLVVDAQEGPMPQTRFVLKKSLELGLIPIVVINKIDKPAARPDEVVEEVYELFLDLGASDEQLNFRTIYASGREGIAKAYPGDESKDLTPLLDAILMYVHPAPADVTKPFRMQPFNLGYDNYLGRMAVGRIHEGVVRVGDMMFVRKISGETSDGKITKIYSFHGMEKREVPEAYAGDIVMIAGLPAVDIGETISSLADAELLPAIAIDEPTISLQFLVNDSPFAGRDGKFVTSRQIKERLEKELEINVGLKVDFSASEYFTVYGRGELHIAIMLENMRREGYELQVSQPRVIVKEEDGKTLEPFEETIIDVPTELSGAVIEKLGKRRGVMNDMKEAGSRMRIIFTIPTRGLLGYRNQFMVDTRGQGILSSRFVGFLPHAGEIKKTEVGSMVSMIDGKSSGFALFNLQERGVLYISAGVDVYQGMVIGNVTKGNDLWVNPIKGKQLTNVRAAASDEAIQLIPPFAVTLERGLEIMAEDEYLEITPKHVRIRKKNLKK
ncbi:MAG: translational GTPase TypA [Candidatus Sungbacteria bacterium]|nr:translational GTPase TypA [Candidatus Sungbacteria bacterium]